MSESPRGWGAPFGHFRAPLALDLIQNELLNRVQDDRAGRLPIDGAPVSATEDEAVAATVSNTWWGGLTSRTGMPASRTTTSATLPETSLLRPERPWVADGR